MNRDIKIFGSVPRGVIIMKKVSRTLAAIMSSAAVLISAVGSALPAATAPTITSVAVDDCNDDWLHAEGSKLYDMNGNQVWLTGANWFGMNCTENFPHGLWSADIDNFLSTTASTSFASPFRPSSCSRG